MSLIMIYNRKVIPLNDKEAKVEVDVVGFVDGEPFEVGQLKFPTKQSWTKFWGALQRGTMSVPEMEVKMQNVAPTEDELNSPQQQQPVLNISKPLDAVIEEEPPPKPKKWVGNQLT